MSYHEPVLLKECIEGLKINPDGIYVDVTFGGGGHSKKILESLSDKDLPIEFKLMGFKPRKYEPIHTAILLKIILI